MKKLLLAFSIPLWLACCSTNSQEPGVKTNVPDSLSENLMQKNSVRDNVLQNHQKLIGVSGDLKSFTSLIGKLSDYQISSIAIALDYVRTCIPPGKPEQDLIFQEFYIKSNMVARHVSEMMDYKYRSISEQLEQDKNSPELSAFKENLKEGGFELFSTEGMYFTDVAYDLYYRNFMDRVSASMKEYIVLRKDEIREGFSEDAGMLISFESLYGRVKSWEHFLNTYPDALFKEEANYLYHMYLSTLLTGMDNTPAFEYPNNTLLPELKALYEKIIREGDGSGTSRIISDYYTLLEQHSFQDNDDIKAFLEKNELASMQAVQPMLR